MEQVIVTFILSVIGIIFVFDAIVYATSSYKGKKALSISRNITEWINRSTANLVIFIGSVLLVCVHWIFGKYKD